MIRAAVLLLTAACTAPLSALAEPTLLHNSRALLGGSKFKSGTSTTKSSVAKGTGSSTVIGDDEETNSTSETVVTGAKCMGIATGSDVSLSVDVLISTSGAAVAMICGPGTSAESVVEMFIESAAGAVAKAVVATQLDCVASGNALACASASSAAEAWAAANAAAFASGFAQAIQTCSSCNNFAAAQAEAFGSTLVSITADAAASAQISSCIAGAQAISISAYTKCFAEAYAITFAQTIARALAASDCTSSTAVAFVKAATGSVLYEYSTCSSNIIASGTGKSTGITFGGSGVRSALISVPVAVDSLTDCPQWFADVFQVFQVE